jgi:pimeloyl-CoA dehydrogenase
VRSGVGWVLHGQKLHVLHGSLASRLVVSARIKGLPGERGGLALFLVDPAASGVTVRAHRLIDGSLAAQVDFASAQATVLGDPDDGAQTMAAIDGALRAGISAVCAEAVGAMEAAYELTLDYLNTRKQFGKAIGTNQALRHRASEMLVGLETARSASIMAALAIDDPALDNAIADLHRAKMLVGRHGRFVTQQAIQLHGGIGMTQEYAVGHYHRRFLVIDQLFGDGDAHAARLNDCLA